MTAMSDRYLAVLEELEESQDINERTLSQWSQNDFEVDQNSVYWLGHDRDEEMELAEEKELHLGFQTDEDLDEDMDLWFYLKSLKEDLFWVKCLNMKEMNQSSH